METHNKEKSFMCDKCEYKSSSQLCLKEHLKRHEETKRFLCDAVIIRQIITQISWLTLGRSMGHNELWRLWLYHKTWQNHEEPQIQALNIPGMQWVWLQDQLFDSNEVPQNIKKSWNKKCKMHCNYTININWKNMGLVWI